MPSQSSSKTQVEAGLKSQEREKLPLPLEDTSIPVLLKNRFKGFVQSVTSVSSFPAIREIIGTVSCMIVITYVSGHTLGALFHKKKTEFIHTINDKTNWSL